MTIQEKDKRKEMPRRESWMHTRTYVLVVCGLFFICGLVNIFDVPALTDYGIVKPVYHSASGIFGLVMGFPVILLFTLLHRFLDPTAFEGSSLYLIPSLSDRLIMLAALIVMTVVLFLVVRRLQRFRRIFKWAVYLNYLAFVLIQLYFAPYTTKSLIGQNCVLSGRSFEYEISSTVQLKYTSKEREIVGRRILSVNRYSISHDSGNTWQEFLIGIGENICLQNAGWHNASQFNDQFFWLWQGRNAIFTRDGGETWTLWEGYKYRDAWFEHGYCHIEDISFTDEQHGTMRCNYVEFSGSLKSDDGGLTWHEAKP